MLMNHLVLQEKTILFILADVVGAGRGPGKGEREFARSARREKRARVAS